jgi:hypothetical protein
MTTTFTAHLTTDYAALPSEKYAINVLRNNAECVLDVTGNHLFAASPKHIKADASSILTRNGWAITTKWTETGTGFQATVTAK